MQDISCLNYIGPEFAGGLKFESSSVTPNLTPDKETGRITGWSQQQYRFRQKKIIPASDMPWD
jgi:hypothetical protein